MSVGDPHFTGPISSGLPHEATRERLLDVAEELFARHGFAASSVREITAAAGCNVAAVNYHFGGKAELYREMFRRRLHTLRQHRIRRIEQALAESGSQADLELVLRTFTNAFLEPLVDHSRGRLSIQLIAHEMLDPHLPAGMLVEEMMGPVQESLARAMRQVCPQLSRDAALRCVHSVVGQLLQSILGSRLFDDGQHQYPLLDLPAMVEHIVRFSAAGIQACSRKEEA